MLRSPLDLGSGPKVAFGKVAISIPKGDVVMSPCEKMKTWDVSAALKCNRSMSSTGQLSEMNFFLFFSGVAVAGHTVLSLMAGLLQIHEPVPTANGTGPSMNGVHPGCVSDI